MIPPFDKRGLENFPNHESRNMKKGGEDFREKFKKVKGEVY
jgi:hypothetical protein